MQTIERIKKLEREVAVLRTIVEDEWRWHPSVVKEIFRRGKRARRDHASGRLREAAEVLRRR